MFIVSAKTPQELIYKLAEARASLISEEAFQKYLEQKFPNCLRHYTKWMSNRTTWKLERTAQAVLFGALEKQVVDPSAILDYALLKINPEPNQILGLEDVFRGLETIEGKRLMEVVGYVTGDKGFREKCKMYKR